MKFTKSFLAFLMMLSLGVSTRSQELAQNEKEQQQQRWRLQAIDTIKQVASEAPAWTDKEAGVQALADAADSLWEQDPDLAAKWLRRAWEMTNEVVSAASDERLKEFFTNSSQSQLRATVLSVARRHDQRLVETFLRQMSEEDKTPNKTHGAFDDRTLRSEQLLTAAQQVLNSNLQEAFELAQRSLADGISFKLQNILTELRKKDVALANRLFDAALLRFQSSQPDPSEAQVLAGYLFQPGFTFGANSSGQTMLIVNPSQQNGPTVAQGEPARAKQFLIAVYQLLLTKAMSQETPERRVAAQHILLLGNRLAAPYSTYAPELSQSVRGFMDHLQRDSQKDVATSRTGTQSSASDSKSTARPTQQETYEKRIGELVAAADNEANAAFKGVAYVRAAIATKPEDYRRGKSIAEKIDDNELRSETISFVYYRAALFFVHQSDLDNAVEITRLISDPLRRTVARVAIARSLLDSKADKQAPLTSTLTQQRALEQLSDISKDLAKSDGSTTAVKIMLARIALLVRLDRNQALTALEEAIQVMNKVDNMNLRDTAAPDLGLSAAPASGATVQKPPVDFSFKGAVDRLVALDFELVSSIVARLRQKEANGLARLEVAKSYLERHPVARAEKR